MGYIERLFSLEGQTAIVTGATGGLGQRFAQLLSLAGARVVLVGRRQNKLEEIQTLLQNNKREVFAFPMDLSDPNVLKSGCEKIINAVGRVDVLVNNAGIARWTPVDQEIILQDWDTTFNVNVKAVWLMSNYISKHMVSQGIQGRIINIASVNGSQAPAAGASAYCASKAAVIQLTRQMAIDLSQYGIRVNAIAPGLIYSDMTADTISKYHKQLVDHIPLGTIGNPFDLDGALLLMASAKASAYLTGATLEVDGGVGLNAQNMTWGVKAS